ncbi:alpha/beta hydrolase [Paenibacillus antarcticus]|uniref:Carboxylesterase n=1 Tax=Paenibacillus antarcticus TaxID=253703 RepID=A0A168MFY8_9BACL|nr:alpha/beta hydrolase [Paenibacillus antarcticus]OAB44628.1 carboxylesterase [Paenibacillus antarcticus]
MKHIFKQGSDVSAPTLVLFHGTGGTEEDLMPIGQMISPSSSILSVRGNVLENGMPRFFRRLAEGVFDEVDLVNRTQEVYAFLDEASEKYGIDRRNMVAIGYSNGANIAGSLLFHYEDAFKGAILHHPMVPLRNKELPDLSCIPVFIGAGRNDMMCPAQESEDLKALLVGAGSVTDLHWENNGHQLSRTEIDAAGEWFSKHFS